ncbi:hypothetical protein LCGC14_0566790 [marine sediment metagenome]|uniref:Uncharacterized protein n=1 Tax=marine sediment metagenome TaxID=412755 RepID=A0A0F9S3X4_9ZZZZ
MVNERKEIKRLHEEFDALGHRKYNLGGPGIKILSKIHKLECELEGKTS